jgi:hypothetical protein
MNLISMTCFEFAQFAAGEQGMFRIFMLACLLLPVAHAEQAVLPVTGRPVDTYSIVARDPDNGQPGVAVQSHWFSAGSLVPWAQAGVGAIAPRSFVELRYGVSGLELMASGLSAPRTLAALLAADANPGVPRLARAGLLEADAAVLQRIAMAAREAGVKQTGETHE